jgi:hypothetical protein
MRTEHAGTERPGTYPSYLSWCGVCRRTEPFTNDDMKRYARDGWPECCGQKMMCYAPPRPMEFGSNPV